MNNQKIYSTNTINQQKKSIPFNILNALFCAPCSPVILGILIYSIIAVSLWYKKPKVMFNKDGTMKPFGTGRQKTLFSYPVVLCLVAILLYFILRYVHIIVEKNMKVSVKSVPKPPIQQTRSNSSYPMFTQQGGYQGPYYYPPHPIMYPGVHHNTGQSFF